MTWEPLLARLDPVRRAQMNLLRPMMAPIEAPFLDPNVTEIFINSPTCIRIRTKGLDTVSTAQYDPRRLELMMDQIATFNGAKLGWGPDLDPILEGVLPDGSRCSGALEGVNADSAHLTIRKHRQTHLTLDDLVKAGSVSEAALAYLKTVMDHGGHVLISGGTGSGKTTFLNTLSSFLPRHHRIITVEDTPELQLQADHVLRLRTAPYANVDPTRLMRLTMRETGDHIVFGEIRGAEAWPLALALNSGHAASMTTIHADGPEEALEKFADYCLLFNGNVPTHVYAKRIARTFAAIVQLQKCRRTHRRHVVSIGSCDGFDPNQHRFRVTFRFARQGDRLEPCETDRNAEWPHPL